MQVDDGLGAAMGLHMARSAADAGVAQAADARAICTWLNERLNAVEAALGIASEPCPELPSEKKAREHAEYLAREKARNKERKL